MTVSKLQRKLARGWVGHHRGLILFVSLVSLVIISPLLDVDSKTWTFALLNTIVFIAGQLSLGVRRSIVLVGLILGGPYLVAVWGWWLTDYEPAYDVQLLSGAAFFGYVAVIMLKVLFHDRKVKSDHLIGAAAAYMLIAAAWGFLYLFVDDAVARTGRTAFASTTTLEDPDLFYFSVVTLTTLGYGDITPVAPIVRALAAIEAMVGVMFIAIIVSRLVAMHHVHSHSHGRGHRHKRGHERAHDVP